MAEKELTAEYAKDIDNVKSVKPARFMPELQLPTA